MPRPERVLTYSVVFYGMNGGKPMNDNDSKTATAERLSDTEWLEDKWNRTDWKTVQNSVKRLQTRIAKATKENKWNTVKRLQYLITHSYNAKLMAVKRVTTNKGKRTAGIDRELWTTPASKMRAVLTLTDKRYKSRPLRRIYIDKKNKKSQKTARNTNNVRPGYAGTVCYRT